MFILRISAVMLSGVEARTAEFTLPKN